MALLVQYGSGLPQFGKKDGTDISGPITEYYIPTSSGSYSCIVKLTTQPAVPSSNTVKFITSGRTVLTLSTSATKPIIGGRVILKCGDVLYDQVTYTWIKDNLYIYSQSDRKLQLDDVALKDGGEYYCTYTSKDKYFKRSNKITLLPRILGALDP
ncbi:hypothetical protein Btru_061307 [Bulinus truncatus]|nr:hypothetical protein Btru_061307 [Bulinus truncatus]